MASVKTTLNSTESSDLASLLSVATSLSALGSITGASGDDMNGSSFSNGLCTYIACHPGDTLIHTPSGLVRIADVLPGDTVTGLDPFGAEIPVRVERIDIKKDNTDLVVIDHASGTLRATSEHPIWVDETGFTKALDVQVGHHVRVRGGGPRTITDVTVERIEQHTVYNIKLPKTTTHVYFADGVLCHNKG